MGDAPARIWLDWPDANRGEAVYDEPPERETQPGQTEYLRADIAAAREADLRAEVERLTEENAGLAMFQCHAGYGDEYGNARCAALDELRSEANRLRALLDEARAALGPCLTMLDDLVAESGRGIDWGYEDAFRMGEWFEKENLQAIANARAALAKLGEKK